MRIAVLLSGTGSNLRAIHREGIHIDLAVADRRCEGLTLAHSFGIHNALIERKSWGQTFVREVYTREIVDELRNWGIELVVMAGFMTVLSKEMFEAFPNRVLNIHPSRLPLFPGAHAVRDTLAANPRTKITGSTIHLAGPDVDDSSRILFQTIVDVRPNDTEESLTARIKEAEHKIYPTAIRDYMHYLQTAR